jgi:hypothetical protein
VAIRDLFNETLPEAATAAEGFERGFVMLQLKDPPERVPVEAWVRGPFAIHFTVHGCAKITHRATGLHIWTFDELDEASEAVKKIEGLTDWGAFDKPTTRNDVADKVEVICRGIEWGGIPVELHEDGTVSIIET